MKHPLVIATCVLLVTALPASASAQIVCSPDPLDGCKRPTRARKGRLVLKDRSPDTRDSFVWSWKRGNETLASEFGFPNLTMDYVLCMYEEGGSAPVLEATRTGKASGPGGICKFSPLPRTVIAALPSSPSSSRASIRVLAVRAGRAAMARSTRERRVTMATRRTVMVARAYANAIRRRRLLCAT